MKRVEIIANYSVEEDILEILENRDLATHFTKIPHVHGQGNSDPKQGNATWPEENFILLIYAEAEKAQLISETIQEIKEAFPTEGIRCFITN